MRPPRLGRAQQGPDAAVGLTLGGSRWEVRGRSQSCGPLSAGPQAAVTSGSHTLCQVTPLGRPDWACLAASSCPGVPGPGSGSVWGLPVLSRALKIFLLLPEGHWTWPGSCPVAAPTCSLSPHITLLLWPQMPLCGTQTNEPNLPEMVGSPDPTRPHPAFWGPTSLSSYRPHGPPISSDPQALAGTHRKTHWPLNLGPPCTLGCTPCWNRTRSSQVTAHSLRISHRREERLLPHQPPHTPVRSQRRHD